MNAIDCQTVWVPTEDMLGDGYETFPGACTERSGIHAFDREAPEFNSQPLSASMAVTFYYEKLMALEAKVNGISLRDRRTMELDATRASMRVGASLPGRYPTKQTLKYVPAEGEEEEAFIISYTDFVTRE